MYAWNRRSVLVRLKSFLRQPEMQDSTFATRDPDVIRDSSIVLADHPREHQNWSNLHAKPSSCLTTHPGPSTHERTVSPVQCTQEIRAPAQDAVAVTESSKWRLERDLERSLVVQISHCRTG